MFSEVGISVPEPGHVQIQILVIQVPQQALLGQILQLVQVQHVPGIGVDLPLDGELQLVVVAVIVRIVAVPEDLSVPVARRISGCGRDARR